MDIEWLSPDLMAQSWRNEAASYCLILSDGYGLFYSTKILAFEALKYRLSNLSYFFTLPGLKPLFYALSKLQYYPIRLSSSFGSLAKLTCFLLRRYSNGWQNDIFYITKLSFLIFEFVFNRHKTNVNGLTGFWRASRYHRFRIYFMLVLLRNFSVPSNILVLNRMTRY